MELRLKNVLVLFTLLFTVACFQSCKTEGCTDIQAENYDEDADEDDGSCTYARTKFIGTYGAGESCNGADAVSQVIIITESTAGADKVTVTNQTLGVDVEATITGNTLSINDTFTLNGSLVNMVGTGTYELDGEDEDIVVNYTLDVGGQIVSTCVALWAKI